MLGSDTVLLEYDLGPDFSGVGVLTSTEVHIYRLPGQEVINKALEEFLPTLRTPLIGKQKSTGMSNSPRAFISLYSDRPK